jgi:hypothetical protein
MSIQEVSAEQLAELFHHYDQALRADHNRASKPDAEAWEQMPHQERSRLVAVARLAYKPEIAQSPGGRLAITYLCQSTSRTEGGSDSFDLRNLSTDQATRARISVRRTPGLGRSPITAPIRPNTHGLGRPAVI